MLGRKVWIQRIVNAIVGMLINHAAVDASWQRAGFRFVVAVVVAVADAKALAQRWQWSCILIERIEILQIEASIVAIVQRY